jgi:hypothetical protein
MRHIRALAFLAGAAAVLGYPATARSSDHGDSPAVQADETTDINDVYAWMSDATHVTLVMTVEFDAPPGAMFSNAVRYVFHTASAAAFNPALPTGGTDIIATFDTSASQKVSLWVGTSEYLTGDATGAAGMMSTDGKVKVFTGPRADPFFFNFAGFGNTVTTVEAVSPLPAGTGPGGDAGCPLVTAGQSGLLGTLLKTSTLDGGAPAVNAFANLNALAIVVQIDKSLLTTATQPLLTVWGGTYKAP